MKSWGRMATVAGLLVCFGTAAVLVPQGAAMAQVMKKKKKEAKESDAPPPRPTDPKLIEFVYGPQGKPALTPRTKNDDVQFNLAHADSVGLVAVTRTAAIGVDIERIRPLSDMNQLVHRFFSPRESRAFQKLAAELKPAAFFNLWTRKEAWLKATGQGIAHYLHQVEVSFLPGEPARLLGLPGELRCGEEWSLRDLKTAPGFAAALAVSCEEPIVTCRRWDFPDSADVAVEQSSKSTLEIPGRARTSVHNQQVLFSKP